MTARPVIFISAVTKELGTARGLAARFVHSLGYDPKDQVMARTEHGSLRGVLRKWIDQSEGVIQLVGKCHGSEPREPDPEFGRVSYTQFEALYARKLGKPVWYFFLGEGFKPDPHEEESEELRELQHAYCEGIRETGDTRYRFTNEAELENCIHRIHDHLDELRREWQDEQRRARRFRVFAGFGILLLLAIGIAGLQLGWWAKKGTDAIKKDTAEIRADTDEIRGTLGKTEQKVDILREDNAKLLQALRELPQTLNQQAQAGQQDDEAARLSRAYAIIEKDLHLEQGTLERELPAFAEKLLLRSDVGDLERANALFATRRFAEAETLALKAGEKARADGPEHATDALDALLLAGYSALAQFQFTRALEHYHTAATLTDKRRDPALWASVQFGVSRVLFAAGRYQEAERATRDTIAIFQRVLGPEHPDTLWARNNLASTLDGLGNYPAAEQEEREVLAIRERVLGAEHPDTLVSRNNLADTLRDQGKYAEAEQEHRVLGLLMERVQGAEHPDTLKNRHNLGNVLRDLAKFDEAEQVHRAVLTIRKRVLGAEHPDTLSSRNSLASILNEAHRLEEAEQEHRAVLTVRLRVLGPEHLDTLASRNNLANVLNNLGKNAEAEQENRQALAIRERIQGPEHPATLIARGNLANSLAIQGKLPEAEKEFRTVLAGQEHAQGEGHPDGFRTCFNLALCLEKQDKQQEALPFARRALEGRTKVFGSQHRNTREAQTMVDRLENR